MSGRTPHLDIEVLAEYRAGLIAGRRGAALAAHLADCDRCAALDSDLAEVSAVLAAVPPPTLPADLANRLDMALAAEVAERESHSERAVVARSGPRRTDGWLGWNRRFLRVLVPAAAVVLAGVGFGLSQVGGSPVSTAASAPAPSAIPAASTVHAPHGSVRAGAVEGTTFPFAVSDTNYTRATLRKQIEAAVRASATVPYAQVAPQQVRACVPHVTGGAVPVLVQSAHYQGQPATVIVVHTTTGDMVWVMSPRCSPLDATTLPPGI